MRKMTVWALFDSGNGSYTKGAEVINRSGGANIDIYPIGIDVEKKNSHYIELNLADYGRLFGDDTMFETLDKLPKPDLIIASPPCESWSNASAMSEGNACWKQERGDSLFEPQIPLSRFTIRNKEDYRGYQFKFDKSLMKRINGELCIFNTIAIIKRYQPKYWIIENPRYGRIWEYIEKIIGFVLPFENPTRYNNYGYPVSKPTRFSGNIELSLKNEIIPNEVDFKDFSSNYNERSNIPQQLVIDIFNKVLDYLEQIDKEVLDDRP